MEISLDMKESQPNDPMLPQPQPVMTTRSTWKSIQTVLNVTNHMLIAIVSIYMTYIAYSNGNVAISWHVFLCTMGYQLLMAQAIMSFYSQNIWSKKYPRHTQRTLHWILQVIGSSAAIIGIITEYIGRWQKSKNHFISTHSTIGLIAGICTLITMMSGISALWSTKLKKYARPIYFKMMHNFGGMTVFILGMTALYFGYEKSFMTKKTNEYTRKFLQAVVISTIAWSLIGAARALLNQLRTAFTK